MTKINVFKISKGYSIGIIIIGIVLTLFGIFFTIRAIIDGFNNKLPGDWLLVWNIVYGLLFIGIGTRNFLSKKYYIEWDENELHFFLPGTKRNESVKFTDIVSVNIKLFEIQLNLKESIIVMDLNNLQFEDLKKVKEKFEMVNS